MDSRTNLPWKLGAKIWCNNWCGLIWIALFHVSCRWLKFYLDKLEGNIWCSIWHGLIWIETDLIFCRILQQVVVWIYLNTKRNTDCSSAAYYKSFSGSSWRPLPSKRIFFQFAIYKDQVLDPYMQWFCDLFMCWSTSYPKLGIWINITWKLWTLPLVLMSYSVEIR